jgi:hypothetical protein
MEKTLSSAGSQLLDQRSADQQYQVCFWSRPSPQLLVMWSFDPRPQHLVFYQVWQNTGHLGFRPVIFKPTGSFASLKVRVSFPVSAFLLMNSRSRLIQHVHGTVRRHSESLAPARRRRLAKLISAATFPNGPIAR